MSSRAGSVRVLEQELMLEAEARRLPSGKCRLSLGARKCSGRECKAGKKRLGGISSRNHVVRCSLLLAPATYTQLSPRESRAHGRLDSVFETPKVCFKRLYQLPSRPFARVFRRFLLERTAAPSPCTRTAS